MQKNNCSKNKNCSRDKRGSMVADMGEYPDTTDATSNGTNSDYNSGANGHTLGYISACIVSSIVIYIAYEKLEGLSFLVCYMTAIFIYSGILKIKKGRNEWNRHDIFSVLLGSALALWAPFVVLMVIL